MRQSEEKKNNKMFRIKSKTVWIKKFGGLNKGGRKFQGHKLQGQYIYYIIHQITNQIFV